MKQRRIILSQDEIPRQWYNILSDIKLNPPLGPDGKPVSPDMLAPVFPMNIIEQEVASAQFIDIPEEVLEVLTMWRPTPLVRAYELEKALDTPARIYYKDESVSPAGSHKPNTAVAQAYYNKVFGIERMVTETGAGQWGSALSFACSQFGLKCDVFMVRVSFDQKPYRKTMMQTWGANCISSPSTLTQAGRAVLEEMPDTTGSLGIAISEAIEAAISDKSGKSRYSLGSVLNHVLLHQTIIGLEAKKQMKQISEYPDIIIGCAGGGSNFAGLAFPFVQDKLNGRDIAIYPVEPSACPTMTKAPFVYDHGDEAGYTPLLAMHSLGHKFIPAPIHAGGLRYHGMAPSVSALVEHGDIEARAVHQLETFEAAVQFSQAEGIMPAPETAHAVRVAMDEALKCKETGEKKVIAFNLSGHGHFDMSAYEAYMKGGLQDYDYPQRAIEDAMKDLPQIG